VIYLGDYYLTIVSARNHQGYLNEHVKYEGSLELTPQFQADVDKLRTVSPRFLFYWVFSSAMIMLLWWVTGEIGLPQMYSFFIGALILREAAIHMRHFRNLVVYYIGKKGGIKGVVEYELWFILQLSAAEMLSFGVLYLLGAMIGGGWFFYGGTFGCVVVAMQHWKLSKKAVKPVQGNCEEAQNA